MQRTLSSRQKSDNRIAPNLPDTIRTVAELEDALSAPPAYVVDALRQIDGDVMILGVAGKMGPTLSRMVRRAADLAGSTRRVIGISRFSKPAEQASLESVGVQTIKCDLLDPAALNALPDCPNVIYMAGMKFGTTGGEALTWAINALLPAMVCQKFRRSRIVAFSTGNVYGNVPVQSGGSTETDPLAPVGEYAMSCLARERMFQYFSGALGIPISIIRLSYACELRYGVLVDLAQRVASGATVDLSMGNFNVIWQADANAMSIASLALASSPPCVLNVTGPETFSVRAVCQRMAQAMRRDVSFAGEEASSALLNNAQLSHAHFGYPQVGGRRLIDWVAEWVRNGGETSGKPTHFEVRDGKY